MPTEILYLSQALTQEDKELDALIQPQSQSLKSKDTSEGCDFSDYSDEWNPDDDSEEEQNETWYGELVKNYFTGSEKNFAKARELYKIVQTETNHKIAVFYKLKDKTNIPAAFDKIQKAFSQRLLDEAVNSDLLNKLLDEADKSDLLNELLDKVKVQFELAISNPGAKDQDKNIALSLLEKIDLIRSFLINKVLNKDNIQLMFKELRLKEIILEAEYKKFFNIDMPQEVMKKTGVLYSPEVLHCWSTNLSWVLAHVRKGSEFLVCTDILQNKFRRTSGSQTEYSAFLREICAALKVGYTLFSINSKITLKPYNLAIEYLQKADTTAQLGNGINPSNEEIEKFFNDLAKHISSHKDFAYVYDLSKKEHYFNDQPHKLLNIINEPYVQLYIKQICLQDRVDSSRNTSIEELSSDSGTTTDAENQLAVTSSSKLTLKIT